MSATLVWQIVRGNNSFIRKGAQGELFSAEPGNLYNKHSFKYSGLANARSIDISLSGDNLVVKTGRVKTAKQPKKSKETQVIKKKNTRRALVAIGKQASSYRPDLKSAALARAASLAKSVRAKKAAAK